MGFDLRAGAGSSCAGPELCARCARRRCVGSRIAYANKNRTLAVFRLAFRAVTAHNYSTMSLPTQITSLPPQKISVGTSSRMVLAQVLDVSLYTRDMASIDAGSVVAAGEYYVSPTGRRFWCVTSGTLVAPPPDSLEDFEDAGGAVLRPVPQRRQVITLTNVGSTTLYLARGFSAKTNQGIVLRPNEKLEEGYDTDVRPYQGEWYALSSDVDGLLAIQQG